MLKNLLLKAAIRLTKSREPDFTIGPADESPYMLRWWWLPRNRFLNMYVHVFLKDDEDRAYHDHPWASLSLLCRGKLKELFYTDVEIEFGGTPTGSRIIEAGQWSYRPAKFAHRLIVPAQQEPPITIFITGPRIRSWGFHCAQGWRHWKDFVDTTTKGAIGRGCGEMEGEPTETWEWKLHTPTVLVWLIIATAFVTFWMTFFQWIL